MKKTYFIMIPLLFFVLYAKSQDGSLQANPAKQNSKYLKRILPSSELDIISALYTQSGQNAAVSGGIGSEDLQNANSTIVISIPVGRSDKLSISAGISAYTSASSSNVNPFDGNSPADPFVASSGESRSDVWLTAGLAYTHSSKDGNSIIALNGSFSSEYDYNSVGLGGSYSKLFNKKNTELSINGSAFFDQWTLIYPSELRAMGLPTEDEDDEEYFDIEKFILTGNTNYQPRIAELNGRQRNSYTLGLSLSQILSKRAQFIILSDFTRQSGQLSTPFQRVYFKDFANTYIENFHLADDIERLPAQRRKVALGSRFNYYLSENLVFRTFYRYYFDNWHIRAHTASIEMPIKLRMGQYVVYPSYRLYSQTSSTYFAPYDEHWSSQIFYTSDNDLSAYNAHQIGLGIGYRNVFGKGHSLLGELKGIDLKYYYYQRNNGFSSHLLTFGMKMNLLP